MDLLLIALLLAAVGAVVVVALGKVGGGLAPVQPDAAPALEEPLERPGDLDRARFTLAVRGYRMDQVDAVLDEARDLLVARDHEIARLHRLLPAELHLAEDRPVQPRPVEPRAAAPDRVDAPEAAGAPEATGVPEATVVPGVAGAPHGGEAPADPVGEAREPVDPFQTRGTRP